MTLAIFHRTNYNIVGLVYEGRMEILLVVIILVFLPGSVGLFFGPIRYQGALATLEKSKKIGC